MGLFSSKPKTKPTIIISGLKVEYDIANECWEFCHQGTEFMAFGQNFVLPSDERLSAILADLKKLLPEMEARIEKQFSETAEVKPKDGETCIINLSGGDAPDEYVVSWSEGKSWGDLAVDFTIKNHGISDEAWGD
jgi:hypothetical protein